MEIWSLRVFDAVMQTGSVSRAAEQLNCVQSNVTARLKRLEEQLGTKLFVRESRGMRPTRAGRALAGYAGRVFGLLQEAEAAVRSASGPTAPLRIGTMETTLAMRLPGPLAAFTRANPEVRLSIESATTEELLDLVLDHKLDLAFVAGPLEHPQLAIAPAFVEELAMVTPKAGYVTDRPALLSFRPGCAYRALGERVLREAGRLPTPTTEFRSLDGILAGVAAGLGMTVLPRACVERSALADQLAIEEGTQPMRVETLLVHRADAELPDSARRFIETVRGAAGVREAAE
ncbi:MAG: LysR family transcriptional regulator [Alphaproteobacteria bacterium]|nr:LysR family transcriptional regulator [Alphaproteobacteria bacterium]